VSHRPSRTTDHVTDQRTGRLQYLRASWTWQAWIALGLMFIGMMCLMLWLWASGAYWIAWGVILAGYTGCCASLMALILSEPGGSGAS
jgi:hypothetical protein